MDKQVNRKKTRKLLYQELYASTFCKIEEELFYESFFDDVFEFQKDMKYLDEMRKIIKEKEPFFIHIIEKYSPKFDITKMNIVNVLPIYISLWEIFFFSEEIPIKSSVNEAIEIAKVYSDDSSKKIVNWVLNKIIVDHEAIVKEKDENYTKDYSIFK